MPRPNIQIDDEVREMTEEEYAHHLEMQTSMPVLPSEGPA